MDHHAPLFLFLHALPHTAPAFGGGAPAAVAIDLDNRQPSVFASAQGIGLRRTQALHTSALFLGLGEHSQLFHGAGFRTVVDTWQDVFEDVVAGLVGCGPDGFFLDEDTSTFIDMDMFPEDTLHGTDPGFWTPDAREHRAGVLHTRDAAIWTGNTDGGFAPSLCPRDYVDSEDRGTIDQGGACAPLLHAALAAAGLPAPAGGDLADALDRVLIGTIAKASSAHGAVAARQRLGEDLALLPGIWRHMGADPRTVVPVLL